MKKPKTKSKTSKASRKADESPSKPQAKKKVRRTPHQSTKATDARAGMTETSAESLATTATTTLTEMPVAVGAETSETATAPAVTAESPASTEPATSDSRMPAIGTVLQKRDRKGTLRCECEVVEGGVRYGGTVYRSLSSAAVAAAKDLGLAAKAMNGFTFWGVTKPARSAADPLSGLERAWNKYQTRMESVLERARAGEHRDLALTTLQRHARVLQNLHEEIPSA